MKIFSIKQFFILFIVFTFSVFFITCLVAKPSMAAQTKALQQNELLDPLDRVQREINILRNTISAESNASLRELAKNKNEFMTEYAKIKVRKRELERTLDALQVKFEEQTLQLNTLELEASNQAGSRKALEGAAKINTNLMIERLQYAPYASMKYVNHEALQALTSTERFPSFEQINALLVMQLDEMKNSAKLNIQDGLVYASDGSPQNASILYAGGLFAVAKLDSGEITSLRPADSGQKLMIAPGKLSSREQSYFTEYFEGDGDIIPADFSKGELFSSSEEQKSFIAHILAGGFLVWPIILSGILAGAFGLWRLLCLFRIKLGEKEVFDAFFILLGQGNFEKAHLLLKRHQTEGILTYALLNHMLNNWNKTVISLEKCYEEAMLIYLNPLEKGITFVAVAAAVAPLMGLLGTVTGMISTFDIITLYGNSDPKLLSGGISVALVTTEIGLIVAIPLMFLHFFISRRLEVIEQYLDTKGTMCIARASGFLVQSALTGYSDEHVE